MRAGLDAGAADSGWATASAEHLLVPLRRSALPAAPGGLPAGTRGKCCPGGLVLRVGRAAGTSRNVGQVVGWGAQGHGPKGGSSDPRRPLVLEQRNFKICTPTTFFFIICYR